MKKEHTLVMRHLILTALVLSACHASAPAATTPPIVDHSRPARTISLMAPAEAAAAVDSIYRLAPDRRFLLAVRDLYSLQEGRNGTIDIDFKNDAWQVRCDGRDVGHLPLLPTFDDGFALLAAWSKALKPFAKNVEEDARTAVSLDAQLVDVFELGDPVAARALALLTIARAANPRFGNDEKALLANAMSYETEAARMGASLPRALTSEQSDERLQLLLKAGAPTTSPLIGEDVMRAWHDALYYTSIEHKFRIESDHYGSEKRTSDFLQHLGTTESQPAHDVHDVLAIVKATKFGSGRGVTARQLLNAKNVGAGLRADLFTELARMHGSDQGDIDAEPAIMALLDTRPTQRFEAGLITLFVTGDPMRRELYLGSAIEAAPNSVKPGYVSYFASITGDKEQLRRLIERTDLSPYDRATAAIYLANNGDPEGADRGFERLFRETDYREFYSAWAGMMNKRRDWKAKERVARDWLDKHPDRDIEHAYYAASLGDALEHQGRYAEAWAIVEPDIDVWSANIIEEAASLHQRLGRVKESDDLGQQLVKRYPGAWTRSGYAVVLWRQKRWGDAAALFNPKLADYSASEWDEHVPDDMAASFEHAPVEDMAAAAGALADAGLDTNRLDRLVSRLMEIGHPELAFAAADEICKRIPLKNEPDSAQHRVDAYRALAAWKGQSAAIQWLREPLTDENALQVASILFENHQDEAVLALADFAPRVRTDEMQVFLAAAMTRLRLPDSDPRVVALRNEVAAQKYDPKALHAVTRYFLGLMDEKDFLGWSKEPWARSSILYAIGLKSAATGDYDRGLQFILAARHVAFDSPPQAWAEMMLHHWNHERGTWRDIVAKRIL